MLARIRAGGRRFIAAASGPPVMLAALLRMDAWRLTRPGPVVRDRPRSFGERMAARLRVCHDRMKKPSFSVAG